MEFTINFDSINLLAVFTATLAANLLGGLWYAPFFLGKPWKAAAGIAVGESMTNPAATFTAGFALQFIAASLLAALLGPSGDILEGVQLGALLSFAFVFTALSISNLFEHRPVQLILINAGFHIAALSLMGAIIGAWR